MFLILLTNNNCNFCLHKGQVVHLLYAQDIGHPAYTIDYESSGMGKFPFKLIDAGRGGCAIPLLLIVIVVVITVQKKSGNIKMWRLNNGGV